MHPNAACKPAPIVAALPAAAILLCALCLGGMHAAAQGHPTTPTRVYDGQPGVGADVPGPADPSDAQSIEYEKRLRRLNADRQKSLVADTARLLRLAQKLNDEFAASPGYSTPAQLREFAEIEKLAHSVKSKMSTSVRELSPFPEPIVPVR